MARDCLLSYRGNRYSVPHPHAGKSVLVREPLDAGTIRVFAQSDLIAEHKTATGKGAMVVEAAHYGDLHGRHRTAAVKPPPQAVAELSPDPGVGLHYPSPEVELRSLSIYNVFCETGVPSDGSSSLGWEEVAHVASV